MTLRNVSGEFVEKLGTHILCFWAFYLS